MFQFRAQFRRHESPNMLNSNALWIISSGTVPELKRNWFFQFRASSELRAWRKLRPGLCVWHWLVVGTPRGNTSLRES